MSHTDAGKADRMDVAYIAELARLRLTPEELDKFSRQLDQVIGYVKKIGELNVGGIEPTSHATRIENVFRSDNVKQGLDRETVLRNAPAHFKDQFKVPKIME